MDELISTLMSLLGVLVGGLIGFYGAYLQRIWDARSAARKVLGLCQLQIQTIMNYRCPGSGSQITDESVERIIRRLESHLNDFYATIIVCGRREQSRLEPLYSRMRRLVFEWDDRIWYADPSNDDHKRLKDISDEIDKVLGRVKT